MRLALAQINLIVGDIDGNAERASKAISEAESAGANLVVLPEMTLVGYPPEDLLFKDHFLDDAEAALKQVAATATKTVAVIGFPERGPAGVYNSVAIASGGQVNAIARKVRLPNYGVFDEFRYFAEGTGSTVVEVDGEDVAVTICEDLWLADGPALAATESGASLIINASASPYHRGKGHVREAMLAQRARDHVAAVALCNMVGGQDELVFDGHSVVLDHSGRTIARADQFKEDLLICDVNLDAVKTARLRDPRARLGGDPRLTDQVKRTSGLVSGAKVPKRLKGTSAAIEESRVQAPLDPVAEVYEALVCGTRDYIEKNGFKDICLGLSGGIDSTLVLLVAVDAIGKDRCHAVVMPSPYSSTGTQSDAHKLADGLNVDCLELPIEPAMKAFDATLADKFKGLKADLTEENLQARIRGNLLMALSNKFGWLVLTTGNKSEMSVGYSTLYGDSAGGFAVIKDCPKMLVYALVAYRRELFKEQGADPVPGSIVSRPPSAELRPGQRDDQSLPPYPILDRILEGYVEQDLGLEDLIAEGLPSEDVARIIKLVDRAEYKRRQSAPGIKITPRALGRDRRLPITNRYGG